MMSTYEKQADLNLSDLPDELVDAVLSHIPVNEAGRYCTVSRLWCSLLQGNIRFEKLLQRLKDRSFCKQANVAELEKMISPFIEKPKFKAQLFIPLKQLEAEVLDITANPLFRGKDKSELRMDIVEMKELLLKCYGVVALFHGYTSECVFGYNGLDDRAKESAPFAVLEYLLQEGKGKSELQLVNKLISAKIVKLEGPLIFKNNELCMTDKNNDAQSITKILEEVLPEVCHMVRCSTSEFKFLVGMYAGNIIERIEALQRNNSGLKL
ncbi:MAG: hypothetical protein SFW07_03725 [Gammaproteobacteria bacterium]|nr:hypothetical protein [Gammaproteobacteria bacterium]